MSRNLVVCLDGTNNEFGAVNTNVVRLYQAVKDDNTQKRYYDPGVGTFGHPGMMTTLGKKITMGMGMAFGMGATQNIVDAYTFLMREYRDSNDKIWIFGFSRGALEARALAALLHRCGLLKPELETLTPYAVTMSRTVSKKEDKEEQKVEQAGYDTVAKEFRATFSREVEIHFLGLWDTVTAMGNVWSPIAWPYTTNNSSVINVRHAIALDERRAFFRQNRWDPFHGRPATQSVKELWFAGVHSDVGGGYPPDESDLWTHSMEWMVKEAKACGLALDETRLNVEIAASRAACAARGAHGSKLNDSMKGAFPLWYIAEFVPKGRRTRDKNGEFYTQIMWPVWCWFLPWLLGRGQMGRARLIGRARILNELKKKAPGELVHRSALQRFVDDDSYRPEALLKIGMTVDEAKTFLASHAEAYETPVSGESAPPPAAPATPPTPPADPAATPPTPPLT